MPDTPETNPDGEQADVLAESVDLYIRSEYRNRLKRAILESGRFDGSSRQFETMMSVLIDFEMWLMKVFGSGEGRIKEENEVELYRRYYGSRGRITIGDMLDLADKNFKRKLKKTLSAGEKTDEAGAGPKLATEILTVELSGILLPPGEFAMHGKGKKVEGKEACFDERLRQLVGLLVENGIFNDDIVILRGKVDPTMMRKLTYNLVEIPKLNKQILVCDQVGEATFVIDGFLGRDVLMSMTKEQLQERFPSKVGKIVYRNRAQWEEEIRKALFEGLNTGDCAKVNVRERESLRQYITGKYTAEQWAGMSWNDKNQFRVGGMKLWAIATRFGIDNAVINDHFHKLLGQKIYGAENVCLKEYTLEEIREAILAKVPMAEEWAGMKSKEKAKFEILGVKLQAIAGRFGLKGNPINYRDVHKLLGQKIYGAEHECLRVEEKIEYGAGESREEPGGAFSSQ